MGLNQNLISKSDQQILHCPPPTMLDLAPETSDIIMRERKRFQSLTRSLTTFTPFPTEKPKYHAINILHVSLYYSKI